MTKWMIPLACAVLLSACAGTTGGSSGEAKEKAITLLKGLTMKNSGSDYTNEAKMGLARLGWHEN